ncbi:MAG: alpha/beta fold hydrolase, partial [Pseudomonadota bacterium]
MTQAARFEVIGSVEAAAPWIVMVHGISQNHQVFDQQVAAFSGDYRLLLIDLPGHGRSADLPGPYGLQEFASSIGATLDEIDVPRCHYWGTHIGAGAGLLLACRDLRRFASLILEGPVFPGRPMDSVPAILARVAQAVKTDGIKTAREIWWREGPWFDVMRQHPEACRASQQRAMIDEFGGGPWLETDLISRPIEPIESALAALDAPVLIMNGQHDVLDFL